MSANTLEADMKNNCMYPKVLSLYEIVISICIYPKVSSLSETVTYAVTPQTIFFLNDFFSWNLSFRCFMVHHEFIIIFRNYFSIKWNFRKIYPVRSNSEQL